MYIYIYIFMISFTVVLHICICMYWSPAGHRPRLARLRPLRRSHLADQRLCGFEGWHRVLSCLGWWYPHEAMIISVSLDCNCNVSRSKESIVSMDFFLGTRDGTFISHNLPTPLEFLMGVWEWGSHHWGSFLFLVSKTEPITGSFTIPTACLRCLCLPCRGNESELQDKVEVYEPWYLGKQLVDSKTRHVLADSWKPKNAWHAGIYSYILLSPNGHHCLGKQLVFFITFQS